MKKVISMFLVVTMILGSVVLTGCNGSKQQVDGGVKTDSNKEYILIGRVVPLTGFLASFGVGTPDVEQKAIDKINADGGIFIKEYNKKLLLKLIVADSESSSTKASEAATKLVTQDKVDILTASHTPLTVNSVAAVAERYKIPCVTVECPTDVWLSGGQHYWSFHTGFLIEDFCNTIIDMWDLLETNKTVGLLMDNQDGASFTGPMNKIATSRGYKVIDPGLITVGTKDYTSIINQFKAQGVEIITGNMNGPDFTTAWNQFQQTGYLPKIASIGRAALFPADAEAIGNSEAISTEIWWTPEAPYTSALSGMTAKELGTWYEDTLKKQVSGVIGYKYANMEIIIDAMQRAQSLDPQTLRNAIADTDLDTIIGHVKYNDQNYSTPMLLGGQWVKGDKWPWEQNILVNKNNPDTPLSKTPMMAIPGSGK